MKARGSSRAPGRAATLALLAPLCACAATPDRPLAAAASSWFAPAPEAEAGPPLGVPIPAPVPEAPAPLPSGRGPAAEEGMRLLAAGNAEAAIRAFRLAMIEEGPTPASLIGLGAAHRSLGRLGPARDLLSKAAARWPGEPAGRNNLGAVLYDLGRYEAAEAEFRSAADIFMRRGLSPSPEILRNLALAARARQSEAL